MVDYSINEDFDLHYTEWDDFKTVDGLEEFQQDVVIRLHEQQRRLFSSGNRETTKQKIRLTVKRVAKQFDVINSIKRISVRRVVGESASYEVIVNYNTGDTFSEEI